MTWIRVLPGPTEAMVWTGLREGVLGADGSEQRTREEGWPQSVHWPVSELGLGSRKMGSGCLVGPAGRRAVESRRESI